MCQGNELKHISAKKLRKSFEYQRDEKGKNHSWVYALSSSVHSFILADDYHVGGEEEGTRIERVRGRNGKHVRIEMSNGMEENKVSFYVMKSIRKFKVR